jgi:hypothetical protein
MVITWGAPFSAREPLVFFCSSTKSPPYIVLVILSDTLVFAGLHKFIQSRIQTGTASSAGSCEKWVQQSQHPVVSG